MSKHSQHIAVYCRPTDRLHSPPPVVTVEWIPKDHRARTRPFGWCIVPRGTSLAFYFPRPRGDPRQDIVRWLALNGYRATNVPGEYVRDAART